MNITTSTFNIMPDFFKSKEDCIKAMNEIRPQTNSRYKNFTQSIWTAGDEEQFEDYKYSNNNHKEQKDEINLNDNLFNNFELKIWDKYMSLESKDVMNTFRYIFYKFKKGIFIKIMNNELKVFLPFSNVNYVNEWSHKIQIDKSKFNDIPDFIRYIYSLENRNFIQKNVNKYTNTWYCNDYLLRHEFPLKENDTNISVIKNMFEELCLNRKIPDIEFFINKRDFPIIKNDDTEPYSNIWDSENKPLISHLYKKYVPILSMVSSEKYSDIQFPTTEDWVRVQNKENKWFVNNCREYEDNFNTEWKNKKPTAVFRGSSTGLGVTIETNPRLKISYLSKITNKDENNIPYLDAGITKWNIRVRKISGEKYLKTIDINSLPFSLVNTLSPKQQSEYKYIVNIDGHVNAYRLSLELSMGSVILLVESKWKTWYRKMLIPYFHYIPVKNDLSDLLDIIKWCRNNDDKCQEIIKNAKNFYNKYLQKNGILDYLQNLLCVLKNKIGSYKYYDISPKDIQYKYQIDQISNISEYTYPKTSKNISDINYFPIVKRDYSFLEGIRLIINFINKNSSFEKVAIIKDEIFKSKNKNISKYELNKFLFIVKSTNNSKKKYEDIHELFVALKCTNKLSKIIPNFSFVFGSFNKDNYTNIISEFIEGQTLFDYIKSKKFNLNEFIFIIIQISLALQVSQNKYAFSHNDITPWNIVIKRSPDYENIQYPINYKNIINIKSNIIPVFIDYGKSHIIVDDIHYGTINMYKFNSIYDILSLIITSIYNIFIYQKNLKQKDIDSLLYISKFISKLNNTYTFNNYKQLFNFLHFNHKFSNLIKNIDNNINTKTPFDFFEYIISKFTYKNITYSDTLYQSPDNSVQIFNYILSKNENEQIDSFINVFNKINSFKHIYHSHDIIFIYYIFQELDNLIIYNWNNLLIFLKSRTNKNTNIYKKIFNKLKHKLTKYFKKNILLSSKEIKYFNIDVPHINNIIDKNYKLLNHINFNENIYLYSSDLNTLLEDYTEIPNSNDYLDYKDICEYVLYNKGSFSLNYKDNTHYENQLKNLLYINPINISINNSNIKTIKKNKNFKFY